MPPPQKRYQAKLGMLKFNAAPRKTTVGRPVMRGFKTTSPAVLRQAREMANGAYVPQNHDERYRVYGTTVYEEIRSKIVQSEITKIQAALKHKAKSPEKKIISPAQIMRIINTKQVNTVAEKKYHNKALNAMLNNISSNNDNNVVVNNLPSRTELKKMRVLELKELLVSRGQAQSGKKNDLINRLEQPFRQQRNAKAQEKKQIKTKKPPTAMDKLRAKSKKVKIVVAKTKQNVTGNGVMNQVVIPPAPPSRKPLTPVHSVKAHPLMKTPPLIKSPKKTGFIRPALRKRVNEVKQNNNPWNIIAKYADNKQERAKQHKLKNVNYTVYSPARTGTQNTNSANRDQLIMNDAEAKQFWNIAGKTPTPQTPWGHRSAHSKQAHKQAGNVIYKNYLNSLDPKNLIKEKGYNITRIERKSKNVNNPYRHKNLMQITRNMGIFNGGEKSKYTNTELRKLIHTRLN